MLADIGIVLVAYTGIRFYETFRKKQKQKQQKDKQQNTLIKQTSKLKKNIVDKTETQQHRHYIKVTVVSMGVAAARYLYPPLAILHLGLFTYITIPYFKQIENSLLIKRKIDGYVLFGIADSMTLALGYYVTASFAVGLVHTAKFIIANAEDHSKKKLLEVFEQQPRKAWILKNGVETEIPIEQLQSNDTVVVNTGEVIPVDGLIVDGIASIDQHALTGESQPAEKSIGEQVFASTIVITGKLYIQVEKSGQETTVAKIEHILNHSIDFKSTLQLKGEQWADSWNIPVLSLAFLSWPILGPVGTVAILNGHVAQTIRIIAPLGTLNHINLASHKGILIKDGRVLEQLSNIDTVLFDKTGTLTQEQPTVGKIILSDDEENEETILAYAAAAERKLAHPIAKAIVQKAKETNLTLPDIEDSKYQIGYGITVSIANQTIRVGSPRFMNLEGVTIPVRIQEAITKAHNEGHSLIMVAVDAKVRGALEMQASVRPEIQAIILGLRQRGIKHLAIVSGDHQKPTQKLAELLGMDSYFYDILPENKAKIVEKLQKEGKKVAFIGDGVNDALAMKKADVSLSLSGATSIATDVAQIVFMAGNLAHLCELFDLSYDLEVNLRNSLLINIIPGIVTIGGAFFLHIGILTAILLNQSGLIVGLGNAMLPLLKMDNDNKMLKPN